MRCKQLQLQYKCHILSVIITTYAVVKERPEWDLNLDLCDTSKVFYQLSYQANWGLAVMWVHHINPNIYMYLYPYISKITKKVRML